MRRGIRGGKRWAPFDCPSCGAPVGSPEALSIVFRCAFTHRYPGTWRDVFLDWLRPDKRSGFIIHNLGDIEALEATPEWRRQRRFACMMESASTEAVIMCDACLNEANAYRIDGDQIMRDGVAGSPQSWDAHLQEKSWYSPQRHRVVLERAFLLMLAACKQNHSDRVATGRLRWAILVRDGHRCRGCGATAQESRLHVDHIVPWSKGGLTVAENLQTLCDDCNIGKSDTHPAARTA